MIAIKLNIMNYEDATTVPFAGLTALYFLRKGNINRGQKVLINGAGGSIGTFAVQLAKLFGAEVIGVDSTNKLEMLHSIGADHVIDFTQEDFTRNTEIYDVIFNVVGKSSFSGCIRSLKKNGIYLLANPTLFKSIRGRWVPMISNKKVIAGTVNERIEDLKYLKELIEKGKLKSVIDRSYPLDQIVEAHKYVETGEKKGNLVIILQ